MNITELTTSVTSSVRIVDRLAGGAEALILAIVTRAAGWVASVPTLLLTSRTCETIFDLAPDAALASAVALEVVGQSVVNTWLRAKEWNRDKRQTDRLASEWLMLAAMIGYFATDFTLVGILVMPQARIEPVYWAALLFPLAQVISTVVTGERAAQFRREADAEADSAKRSVAARERAAARREAERVEREIERARAAAEALIAQVSGDEHGDNGHEQSSVFSDNGGRSFAEFEQAITGGELDVSAMTGWQVGEWAGKSAATGRRWKRLAGRDLPELQDHSIMSSSG